MTKFAEVDTRLRDAERVAAIRAEEAAKVERQFAPVKNRARRNAEYMNKLTGHLAPW